MNLQPIIELLQGVRQELNDCTARLECSECPGFVMVPRDDGLYERRPCACAKHYPGSLPAPKT